jgi:hypothetical protein
MMAEIIHMSQQVSGFSAGMGVWGKDGVLSALPHLSTVETRFHDSSSGLRLRFLRMDSPLSSMR